MRITNEQIIAIRNIAKKCGGDGARVLLFGSRLNHDSIGGDVDLLLELPLPIDNPALLAARVGALVSRAVQGRRVDILLSAPNLLRLPIHEIAYSQGKLL